jgi:hypothetical protein
LNRRDFIVLPAAKPAISLFAAETAVPWQRKSAGPASQHDGTRSRGIRRRAAGGLSGRPEGRCGAVLCHRHSCQTKVPFHRKGKFLGTRDFFGECRAAAKKRGMHNDRANESRLFRTCIFST